MRGAHPALEVNEPEEDDTNASQQLTKAGRRMKKLLAKRGRQGRPDEEEDEDDGEDDDEDDINPYAFGNSSESSDSESDRLRGQRIKDEKDKRGYSGKSSASLSRSGSQAPPNGGPRLPGGLTSRQPSAGPTSRSGSPAAGASPGNLARRATSPALSQSRQASPTPPPSLSKRKAEEGQSPNGDGVATEEKSKKRRKPGSPSPAPPITPVAPGDDSALIPRSDIVDFIRQRGPTTKELLKHFKIAMARDTRNRDIILQVTKEVASMGADKKLVIKAEFA